MRKENQCIIFHCFEPLSMQYSTAQLAPTHAPLSAIQPFHHHCTYSLRLLTFSSFTTPAFFFIFVNTLSFFHFFSTFLPSCSSVLVLFRNRFLVQTNFLFIFLSSLATSPLLPSLFKIIFSLLFSISFFFFTNFFHHF